MPPQSKTNGANKQLKPTLASNRFKSPITPRLVASATPPLSRTSTKSDASANVRSRSSREDLSNNPVRAFINSNVTPRSSRRQSRLDSPSSTPGTATPNDTPSSTRPPSSNEGSVNWRGIGNTMASGGQNGVGGTQRTKSFVAGHGAGTSPLIRSSTFAAGHGRSPLKSPTAENGSKFFHASEAKTSDPAPAPKKAPTFFYANGDQEERQSRFTRSPSPALSAVSARSGGARITKQASTFFYANGQQEESSLKLTRSPSPALSAVSAKSGRSQFFRANGRPEEGPSRFTRSPSPALSAVSAKSSKSQFFHADGTAEDDEVPPLPPLPRRIASPEPLKPEPLRSPPMLNSAATRSQDSIHLSYRKGVSQILRPGSHRTVLPPIPQSSPPRSIPRPHAGSGGKASPRRHNRTSSLSSIEQPSPTKKLSLGATAEPNPQNLSRLAICHNASSGENSLAGTAQLHSSAPASADLPPQGFSHFPRSGPATPQEELPDLTPIGVAGRRRSSGISVSSVPLSPTKANFPGQSPSQLAELAANARRERKVLDLEISNSSLLAINRSLEREVRKQKAELRRFRRLSRAGRFSHGPVASLDDLEDNPETSDRAFADILDGISEDEYISDSEDEASTSGSSANSSALSPTVLAEKDAKKLEKDSKRLQLDLAKHRQLLVDSQKMNQSLKRCMAWTEELICEGRRALDYHVRISDVKLGGRVLRRPEPSAEDDDEEEENDPQTRDHSLLSAWSPASVPRYESAEAFSGLGIKMGQRGSWQSEEDSGIEVDSARNSGTSLVKEKRSVEPATGTGADAAPLQHRLSRDYEVPDG